VTVEIRSGRGAYHLVEAASPETSTECVMLTLALERADGIERVVFRCRIARKLMEHEVEPHGLIERLRPWIEREFEQTREAALKSIRSERKLYEMMFDGAHRGPF
jgi:hypothetical protein